MGGAQTRVIQQNLEMQAVAVVEAGVLLMLEIRHRVQLITMVVQEAIKAVMVVLMEVWEVVLVAQVVALLAYPYQAQPRSTLMEHLVVRMEQ